MVDFNLYEKSIRQPFIKLCRLRFLNSDGTTAFVVDNNDNYKRNKCFIAGGSLSVNLQNGQRRTASVTFDNVDDEFDYNLNHLWFGNQVALDEGLILLDGTEYYMPQGVFLLTQPSDSVQPNERTIQYHLSDKWANLDGTLYGNLEGSYQINSGTLIRTAVKSLLAEDKGNGYPVDSTSPTFVTTNSTTYDITIDADRTLADVILALADADAELVGYDRSGSLRFEPSSDEVDDIDRPVQWTFSMDETTLLGLTYDIKNEEVYNDYIVVGEQLNNGSQPMARVQNYDARSDTNILRIGTKTKRETASGYTTVTQCRDLATWRLKRASVLSKAVNISASQIFHIQENQLVEVIRTDKPGSPIEKHLVQGFSRPLTGKGAMTISAISTVDIPDFTVVNA